MPSINSQSLSLCFSSDAAAVSKLLADVLYLLSEQAKFEKDWASASGFIFKSIQKEVDALSLIHRGVTLKWDTDYESTYYLTAHFPKCVGKDLAIHSLRKLLYRNNSCSSKDQIDEAGVLLMLECLMYFRRWTANINFKQL
jgi:hypothetical protein